jgi:hypothetical protein
MRRIWIFLIVAAGAAATSRAQTGPAYDAYFTEKALRIDLYQTGDAREETVTIHEIYEEPIWPETRSRLVDPINIGRYVLKVYDVASNTLLYARGFDTMFAEYKTTTPALEGTKRVFERSVRIPSPRRPVLFVIEARDKKQLLHPIFSRTIDPADYHILRETAKAGDWVYEAAVAGPPVAAVDFVFVAEGYAAEDRDKFKADVDRFSGFLFSLEPYKSERPKFSIRGVFRPSPERAMDEPRQRVYKKTTLNASFNAFDLDRYMLIEEDHLMHALAAQVPYDVLVVLVNSSRYGGGSICFDYCCTTVDNARSPAVFVHELGHSFAGLADEYYTSEVAYNDFYPKGVEPLEPNITALLDPSNIKWKALLSPGTAIPTEYGKDEVETLQAERQANRKAQAEEVAAAKAKGSPAGEVDKIQEKYRALDKAVAAKIEAVRKKYAHLEDKVGAFEGAGYSSKGLYRPQMYCLMISSPKNEFCAVCQKAIRDMIEYFAGGK